MKELEKFYQSILNIGNKDHMTEIKRIVIEERALLNDKGLELDGLCKYIANQIECRIKEEIPGVHINKIDLRDFNLVDHTILIVEYKKDSEMCRLLVDPTFTQFVRKENTELIKLDSWPGDKINKSTLSSLVSDGLVEVDNATFQNYLDSFSEVSVSVDLDEYLLKERIDNRFIR